MLSVFMYWWFCIMYDIISEYEFTFSSTTRVPINIPCSNSLLFLFLYFSHLLATSRCHSFFALLLPIWVFSYFHTYNFSRILYSWIANKASVATWISQEYLDLIWLHGEKLALIRLLLPFSCWWPYVFCLNI